MSSMIKRRQLYSDPSSQRPAAPLLCRDQPAGGKVSKSSLSQFCWATSGEAASRPSARVKIVRIITLRGEGEVWPQAPAGRRVVKLASPTASAVSVAPILTVELNLSMVSAQGYPPGIICEPVPKAHSSATGRLLVLPTMSKVGWVQLQLMESANCGSGAQLPLAICPSVVVPFSIWNLLRARSTAMS